jgi:glycosyltransferase involved in cell wall biosynthesis
LSSKVALMVCTQARGGMRSVVEAYERDGLFQRWRFKSLRTHLEGSALARITIALRAYIEMLCLLSMGRVSFMHVHAAMRGSFWRKSFFAATARRFGVPSILHLHGSEMKTFYESLSTSRKNAVKQSLEKAAAVVVLSESWREFVTKIAPQARITVISNYVSLPAISPRVLVTSEFKVLFLGILGQRKGIYDLLEIWSAVISAVPGARLLVGGNGEIELAKNRATSLGIASSVDFLGWIDGYRKIELLKSADTFVLPSYNEGLPMSLLEAMSWGMPVVTTRVGGIPELITNNHDGLLIDAGDKTALTNALIRLGTDTTYRVLIGNAGRVRIESNFSDVAILPQLEAVYTSVLPASIPI